VGTALSCEFEHGLTLIDTRYPSTGAYLQRHIVGQQPRTTAYIEHVFAGAQCEHL
jgi:hypothetical protein